MAQTTKTDPPRRKSATGSPAATSKTGSNRSGNSGAKRNKTQTNAGNGEAAGPQLNGGLHGAHIASIAVDFLRKLRPGGPWLLTAIVPDGRTTTITARTATEVEKFVAQHDGKQNIYYSVNPTRTAMSKKAAKTDITAIEYALADLDPRDDETPEAAKARYLDQLEESDVKPTAMVDSGNGLQCLWKLQDRIELGKPLKVTDKDGKASLVFTTEDQAKVDDVEARIAAIMVALGAPKGTQNIDRILRLPGTTNLPNAKKLRTGRVPCPTKLLHFNGAAYPLSAFPKPLEEDPKPKNKTEEKPEEDDKPPITSLDDPPLTAVAADVMTIIRTGEHTDTSMQWGHIHFKAVAELHRAGLSGANIKQVYHLSPLGEYVAESSRGFEGYMNKLIAAVRERADVKLFEMNEKHCVLPIGGKARVATWGDDPDFPGHETIVAVSGFDDFKALHDKYRHAFKNKDGATVTVRRGTWWINHAHRRQYDGGMRFMPNRDEEVVGDTLNLWRGFSVAALKPEGRSGASGCQLFLDHGLKIICSGNEEHFDYLMKREAFIAQKRMRSEIAIGLRTEEEGTGKGTWCRHLNYLYGTAAMQVQNSEHVIGKHNPHLEKLLRLTADEALFAPNPQHRNALYYLITEPSLTIEPKFVNVYTAKNFLNIDILSNAKHFIPVSGFARRFFVPLVSPERANDHAYFHEIEKQMRDGGYEALLYHLLHEIDIRDFNVRNVPKTAALAEQAAYSRKGVDRLVEIACNDGIVLRGEEFAGFSICTDYELDTGGSSGYTKTVRGFDYLINHHSDKELAHFGALTVKRRLVNDWGCITGDATRRMIECTRVGGIIWPPLQELRERFESKYGPQDWTHPEIQDWENREGDTEANIAARKAEDERKKAEQEEQGLHYGSPPGQKREKFR